MALIDTGRIRGQEFPTTTRIRTAAFNVLGLLAEWNDARRTRNALSRLTSHELEDIGLTRADIDEIARQPRF